MLTVRSKIPRFTDRHDAGRQLAERLLAIKPENPVVLALPRGGVPVGFEIARALEAPLDLVLVRKIGAPFEAELAIGAVAEGECPEMVTDPRLVTAMDIPPEYIETTKAAELQEIQRRRQAYLGDRPPVDVTGRTVIIVDDGIATGATMLAALRATRRRHPARIVLATPVAAMRTLERLSPEADETVCVNTPDVFWAVGAFYEQFGQSRDQEVIEHLDRACAFAPSAKPGPRDH